MAEVRTNIANVRLGPTKKFEFKRVPPGAPEHLSVLVYGPPGAGKTWFAGTFPNPFFIDCQGGMLTLRKKNVAYVQPADYDELLQCVIAENVAEFGTVVLDTATEAARIIMEKALKLAGREIAQMQDWMQTIERSRQLFRKVIDLPKHVVVTCEEGIVKDEDTGKILAGPSLPGKLFHEAGALFDCVFHIRSINKPTGKERVLLTQPEGLYQQVKDRTGVLDKHEVPDFQVIWKKLEGAPPEWQHTAIVRGPLLPKA